MKKVIYLLLINVYTSAESIEQAAHNYTLKFKETPNFAHIDLTPAKDIRNASVTFKQKIALKKKKIEYTLALRY